MVFTAVNLFVRVFQEDILATKDIIYHYTSVEALYKIFSTGSLRFTNIRELNDPLEIIHGFNLLDSYFDNKGFDYKAFFYTNLDEPDEIDKLKSNFFVFSTSRVSDDHQQWINYGDRGDGISIGLNSILFYNTIANSLKSRKIYALKFPIQYMDQKGNNHSFKEIKNFYKKVHSVGDFILSNYKGKKRDKILLIFFLCCACMIKTDFHKNENEERFLVIYDLTEDIPEIVLKKNKFSTYHNFQFFDINNAPINSWNEYDFFETITIGPKANNDDLFKEYLLKFLQKFKFHMSYLDISSSKGRLV